MDSFFVGWDDLKFKDVLRSLVHKGEEKVSGLLKLHKSLSQFSLIQWFNLNDFDQPIATSKMRIFELQSFLLWTWFKLTYTLIKYNLTFVSIFRFKNMISSMYDCLTQRVHKKITNLFIVFFFLLLLSYNCFLISPLFLDITVFEGPLDWNSSFLWLEFDLKAPFCLNTFQESFQ